MKRISRRTVLQAAAFLGAPGILATAGAQAYPAKPIKLIVPYPPGGSTDVVARVMGTALAKELGQAVVIENRAGAGGSIGAKAVATATADGYTLGLANTSTHGTNSAVYKNLSYDAVRDFTPITKLIAVPGVIAVHPSFPARNYADFIKLIRSAPGRYSYASSGNGGANHLCMELFKAATNTFMVHIPYRGAGPSINDVLAGQVPILWDALPSSLPFIKDGRLRAIGVVSARRSPQLPDVPTFTELGVKDYEPEIWLGLVAPGGLPSGILASLHAATMKAIARPETRVKLEEMGGRIVGDTPEAFGQSIRGDVERWKKVVKFANIALE